jgi:hypothetical protein
MKTVVLCAFILLASTPMPAQTSSTPTADSSN